MSEHNLILEFYKPTYNLDFDYDGDGGLDLHFTNIKGEFFMTMNDSYNSVYIEDEDCEFSKGEMFATVDLGDLVERIINGEFRQTNGKAVSDWGKRFIGDGEEQIEFNGKNYADGSLFWDDFFKEMSKDEIKDFMTFCEDYLDLPNIEVDTVSNKYDFENGKVELKSNGKWSITVNDDYTIILVDKFTCNSTDACDAYYVASSESDEDDFYESKKSVHKSLKESSKILAKNKKGKVVGYIEPQKDGSFGYAFGSPSQKEVIMFYVDTLEQAKDRIAEHSYDDVIFESKKSTRKSIKESKVDFQSVIDKVLPKEYAKNKNAYRYALSCVTSLYNEDEYDSDSAKVYFLNCYISDLFPSWVDELGEEEIDAFANALYDGTMKWSDIDSSWFESKKSARKNLKEGISAFNKAIAKKYNETEPNSVGQYYLDWRFDLQDEKDNIEAIADRCGVTVEFQSDEGYFEVFEESKKSARKSLKESKLYTYMIGVEPNDWTIDDTKACKKYGITCKGYYVLGDYEGMVLVGTLSDIENFVENYFGAGIAEDYLCPYNTFDFEDGDWITGSWYESKKSAKKSLKEYLVKGLDVDFVVDHLLSLEDLDNFDLINKLSDLWEVYNKSWRKFNKSLSDLWKVTKDIEKLDSFDKTCEEIIDAWYDDIEKIFYSDDNLENLKLNFGFEGNDIF